MNPKILVCDDAYFMRNVIINILQKHGFTEVIEATNGKEAVQLYRLHEPDLVLMDITMPVMDGYEALVTIHTLDPSSKVVMCSSLGRENMIQESVLAGACDFIIKPFLEQKLVETVKKHLQKVPTKPTEHSA